MIQTLAIIVTADEELLLMTWTLAKLTGLQQPVLQRPAKGVACMNTGTETTAGVLGAGVQKVEYVVQQRPRDLSPWHCNRVFEVCSLNHPKKKGNAWTRWRLPLLLAHQQFAQKKGQAMIL